jgi:iron complex outermembrane receptor protein
MDRLKSKTVSGFMFRRFPSVDINEVQDNPFQADISYRGFVASPVVGTPIGISVYQDGARVNESFGDTVNWGLIPQFAIDRIELVPGSNPIFGLNVTVQTPPRNPALNNRNSLSFGCPAVSLGRGV